jgi:adenosylmethionine-8-amino-7-oxononanoate aminotransferase
MEPWPELGSALKRTAKKNGLILRIDPTWFAVAPALTATEAQIDELCDLVERSLVDALEEVQCPRAGASVER